MNPPLLYIGAGTDMNPLLLPTFVHYVFVDQFPNNSNGPMGYEFIKNKKVCIPYTDFYVNIRRNIQRLGMKINKSEKEDKVWIFYITRNKEENILLKYHVNLEFPNLSLDAFHDVAQCSALFICGFIPHHRVLDLAPLRIIYSVGTECYKFAEECVRQLHLDDFTKRFPLRHVEVIQHGGDPSNFANLEDKIFHNVFQWLCGKDLLSCISVSHRFATNSLSNHLWRDVIQYENPNMAKDTFGRQQYLFDSRAQFLDGYKNKRQVEMIWTVPHFLQLDHRWISDDPFIVHDYAFRLIVDPRGNPNTVQSEDNLSVYLECKPFSKINSSSSWNCSCHFSIHLLSRETEKAKSAVWLSTMPDNEFNPFRTNWGCHALCPLDKLTCGDSDYLWNEGRDMKIKVVLEFYMYRIEIFNSLAILGNKGFGWWDPHTPPVHVFPSVSCTISEVQLCEKVKEKIRVDQGQNILVVGSGNIPELMIPLRQKGEGESMISLVEEIPGTPLRLWVEPSEGLWEGSDPMDGSRILIKRFYERKGLMVIGTANPQSLVLGEDYNKMAFWKEMTPADIQSCPLPETPCTDWKNLCPLQNGDILVIYSPNKHTPLINHYRKLVQDLKEEWRILGDPPSPLSYDFKREFNLLLRAGYLEHRLLSWMKKYTPDSGPSMLQYFAKGINLGYCCDGCHEQNFSGDRYHCTLCEDYDLCLQCYPHSLSKPFPHRLQWSFKNKQWEKVPMSDVFIRHESEHEMQKISNFVFCGN